MKRLTWLDGQDGATAKRKLWHSPLSLRRPSLPCPLSRSYAALKDENYIHNDNLLRILRTFINLKHSIP